MDVLVILRWFLNNNLKNKKLSTKKFLVLLDTKYILVIFKRIAITLNYTWLSLRFGGKLGE